MPNSSSQGLYCIYDPIDGAYHFLQGLPLWSSTLVLMERGQPLFSLVYEPVARELFMASRGHGAFFNGAPVVSAPGTRSIGATLYGFWRTFCEDPGGVDRY